MATQAEVRDRAGNDLGLLRLNQQLQAQDAARIEQARDEVYAQLKKEGLATWASTADIPDEIVPYVVALICLNCMTTYGISEARAIRIVGVTGLNGEDALRQIRKYVTPAYLSTEEPTDF